MAYHNKVIHKVMKAGESEKDFKKEILCFCLQQVANSILLVWGLFESDSLVLVKH